jgi:nitrogen regulatory protein PII
MKRVTAIIKPFKLDEVRKAVSDIGVQGVVRIRTGERDASAI